MMLAGLCLGLLSLTLNTSARAADTAAATPANGLSQQDAQQLLSVLNDPQKRAEFSRTLSLMAKGLPAAPAAKQSPGTPGTQAMLDTDVHSELGVLGDTAQSYVQNFTSLFTDLALSAHGCTMCSIHLTCARS